MLDSTKIKNIQKLNSEIENFKDCYACVTDSPLFGNRDGIVSPEVLLAFLIENPHFQQIADEINKSNSKL